MLSKYLWKAEMEDLDVGKSGDGSFKLFFLLVPQFYHYIEDGDSCVNPYSLTAASWNCFQKDF